MSFRTLLAAVFVAAFSVSASAQAPLRLQISEGRVTLHAENVPVRTILAEWARVGGAKIINGEAVAGAPLTLDLEGVPERRALDIVLRGVSGFVLAARQPGTPGMSVYDRIMILPTSVAPRNPAPAPGLAGTAPGIIRPIAPRPGDDQNADNDPDTAQGNDGVPLGRPVPIPRPLVGGLPGSIPNNPPVTVVPDNEPQQPPPPVVSTPANPFGLPAGSSARPGVITPPAPQPPAQQRPPD
jgi:hypothetical protein